MLFIFALFLLPENSMAQLEHIADSRLSDFRKLVFSVPLAKIKLCSE